MPRWRLTPEQDVEIQRIFKGKPMSTEADIVERLLDPDFFARTGTLEEIKTAAAEITQLRAERDAAARDMRERAVALASARAAKRRGWNNFMDMKADEASEIAAEIAALPLSIIATDREVKP
jgi:hypothetical protein